MEKKMFMGVLYLSVFVTFCFILLTTYIQYILNLPVNKNSSTVKPTPISVISQMTPTPSEAPIVWNIYTDSENGFSLEYPMNHPPDEKAVQGYHVIDFYSGCMQITSGTQEKMATLAEKNPFPWGKIDTLRNLSQGQNIDFVTDTWNLGQGEKFDFTYTYKKESPKEIGGMYWNTYSVINNYENHGILMQYFINRNGNFYFISSLTDGPCWTNEPERMLDSFTFINK